VKNKTDPKKHKAMRIKSFFLLIPLIITSITFTYSCKKDNLCSETITETKLFNNAVPTDISFTNELVGFVSSGIETDLGTAVIAKTIDGGKNWEKISVYIEKSPSANIRAIYAKTPDSIYATYNSRDDRRGVCFSNDGGLTWINLGNIIASGAYSGICFKTGQTGFVCSSGDIFQTRDGGISWKTVFDYSGFGGIGKIFFTSDMIGYGYGGFIADNGSNGTIVKTTNGGDNWTELTSMQEFVTCLSFENNNIGYAFTFDNNIYKTTDGGTNWLLLNNLNEVGSSYYSTIVNSNIKYIASGSSVFKSTDDFKTITKIYTSPIYSTELSIKAVKPSDNTIFILSSQQSVIKVVQYYK